MFKMLKEIISNNKKLIHEIFNSDWGFLEVVSFLLGYYQSRSSIIVIKVVKYYAKN